MDPMFWYLLHPTELRKFKVLLLFDFLLVLNTNLPQEMRGFSNQKKYVASVIRLFSELRLTHSKFVKPGIFMV
jgi:hypothetical protein